MNGLSQRVSPPSETNLSSKPFEKRLGTIEILGKRFKVTVISNSQSNLPYSLPTIENKIREIAKAQFKHIGKLNSQPINIKEVKKIAICHNLTTIQTTKNQELSNNYKTELKKTSSEEFMTCKEVFESIFDHEAASCEEEVTSNGFRPIQQEIEVRAALINQARPHLQLPDDLLRAFHLHPSQIENPFRPENGSLNRELNSRIALIRQPSLFYFKHPGAVKNPRKTPLQELLETWEPKTEQSRSMAIVPYLPLGSRISTATKPAPREIDWDKTLTKLIKYLDQALNPRNALIPQPSLPYSIFPRDVTSHLDALIKAWDPSTRPLRSMAIITQLQQVGNYQSWEIKQETNDSMAIVPYLPPESRTLSAIKPAPTEIDWDELMKTKMLTKLIQYLEIETITSESEQFDKLKRLIEKIRKEALQEFENGSEHLELFFRLIEEFKDMKLLAFMENHIIPVSKKYNDVFESETLTGSALEEFRELCISELSDINPQIKLSRAALEHLFTFSANRLRFKAIFERSMETAISSLQSLFNQKGALNESEKQKILQDQLNSILGFKDLSGLSEEEIYAQFFDLFNLSLNRLRFEAIFERSIKTVLTCIQLSLIETGTLIEPEKKKILVPQLKFILECKSLSDLSEKEITERFFNQLNPILNKAPLTESTTTSSKTRFSFFSKIQKMNPLKVSGL